MDLRHSFIPGVASLLLISTMSFATPVAPRETNAEPQTCECKKCHCKDTCKCAHSAKQAKKMSHWQETLNLTPEQVKKIKTIRSSNRDVMKALQEQKWQLYKEMITMGHDKNADKMKLDGLIEKMNSISSSLMKNRIAVKQQIYNMLTPEQQEKMKTILENKLKNMESKYRHQ